MKLRHAILAGTTLLLVGMSAAEFHLHQFHLHDAKERYAGPASGAVASRADEPDRSAGASEPKYAAAGRLL
jgi:hypothetical protein